MNEIKSISAPYRKSASGGDVWVLLIKDTKPSDTDLYVCEVNSDPPVKSFHPLKGKYSFFCCCKIWRFKRKFLIFL